jgi:hypothetical protein
MNERDLVETYFAAMRRGAEAEDDMMALFADDAVYVEPFSGVERESVGRDAIRATLRDGWANPLPDMTIDVHEIEITATGARSRWTCTSPALPGPASGEDRYTIEDGKITRLEVRFLPER